MHDDLSGFRISHPAELGHLLQRLVSEGVPVLVAAPGGANLTTRLCALDPAAGRLHFEVDAEDPPLQALLAADETLAVSHLDQVQLQFTVHGLILVRGEQTSSLQADWPAELLRLQRRDSFRVRPLSSAAPTLSMRHPSMPDMLLTLRVLDVSAGGCAVLLPAYVPELQPGTHVTAARLQLDLQTRLETGLVLQHVSSVDGEDGPRRVGCSFDRLSSHAERALQLYLLNTQKRQRPLAHGS